MRHPWKQGIMLKIMLGWRYNAQIMRDLNDTSTPAPIGPYLLLNESSPSKNRGR